jgi:DNA-binding transcriptional LysR family regulator
MIEHVFSGFLHRYGERRPDVQIKLSDAAGGKALTMLERGELHLGIALKRAVEYDPQAFDSMDLPPVEFIAAYRPSLFHLGAGPNIDISRLAPHPLLPIGGGFWIRQTFDAACRLAGVKPKIFMESNTPHTLLALAENGHGIAILPSVVPTNRYRLETRRITHGHKPLREPLAVLWDRRSALPSYAQDFCDHLAAYMREVFSVPTRGVRRGRSQAKVQRIRRVPRSSRCRLGS